MADPYVNFAPSEVGPCTATWFVGSASGSDFNDSPTFGPATSVQPVGAWDFLVDGPLKDVLTATYASTDAFLEAWATAGGQVDCVAQGADASFFTPSIRGYRDSETSKPIWQPAVTSPLDPPPSPSLPLRWVVKFSVPHSIIR